MDNVNDGRRAGADSNSFFIFEICSDHINYALMMDDRWMKRVSFWVLAIVPFVGVFVAGDLYGANWFALLFMIYILVYRPVLHIFRLLGLQKIEAKDAWKLFNPIYSAKFARVLWLG